MPVPHAPHLLSRRKQRWKRLKRIGGAELTLWLQQFGGGLSHDVHGSSGLEKKKKRPGESGRVSQAEEKKPG